MATTKVSALTSKTTPVGTEEFLINDSGTSKKITKDNITEENFTSTLKTKLDGIETSATADQTDAEIKTAYENNADTNAFTDADHSKLDGIAAGATNVTNNNQLTNGAGYVTTDTNTTYSAGTGLDLTGTTFSVEPDLRDGITHVGRDTNDYIEIATDRIRFYINGVNVMSCDSSGNIIAKGNVSAYGTPI